MKEKQQLYRCICGQSECGPSTGSECKHRIPHIHMGKYCDQGCDYGGKCQRGSFQIGDRYLFLGYSMRITDINNETDRITLKNRKQSDLIVTENVLLHMITEMARRE